MDCSRHYPKAPITEAIIDLRVQPRADLSMDDLVKVRAGNEQSYPGQEAMHETIGTMEVRPGVSASAFARQDQAGFKFTSEDGKYIWQCRRNGFTCSRLSPYESWEPFRDEARRLWTRYRECLKPLAVQRLAVRYINRVDIPAPIVEMKDYFRTMPVVSPDLPQVLAGFFMQLQIRHEDLLIDMLINQTIVPPPQPNTVSVVLDIDLFRSTDVPGGEEAIWAFFEEMHACKNAAFEACITDRTRELIQ
jgi:uncharacterized protein (TIGR04255 family)